MKKLQPEDPDQIGPFEIIARLGAGGMGVVFLGTKGVDRYAIKVVRSSYLDSPDLKSRFRREIETLRKLDSPNVARLVESGTEPDIAWHAVEFINGPNLREFVEANGPLTESAWWALAKQLQRALFDIHSVGIVHRDLKPSNIVMSESGMKVIDFGIAQDNEATSLTTTGLVAGSPAWLSPEQLEGTELTPASDYFSAGSVLAYAATGRSPWGEETTMSVPVLYRKILEAKPNLEGLSSAQSTLIAALMDTDSKERRFEVGEEPPPVQTLSHTNKRTLTLSERQVEPNTAISTSPLVTRKHGRFAVVVIGTIASLVIVSALLSTSQGGEIFGGAETEPVDTAEESAQPVVEVGKDYLKPECNQVEDLRQWLIQQQNWFLRKLRDLRIGETVSVSAKNQHLASLDEYRTKLRNFESELPHDDLDDFLDRQSFLIGDWSNQLSTTPEQYLGYGYPLEFPSARAWNKETREFLEDENGYCFS